MTIKPRNYPNRPDQKTLQVTLNGRVLLTVFFNYIDVVNHELNCFKEC